MKAILDGVIGDAQIHHEQKYVQSKTSMSIYSSTEPQKVFNKRITFCLQLHNDAVKAMQYADVDDHRKGGEGGSGGKDDDKDDQDERRRALQEEMARVEDEELGDDDLDMI